MLQATIETKVLKAALGRLSNVPGSHVAVKGLSLVSLTSDIEGLSICRTTPLARVKLPLDASVDDEGEVLVSIVGLNNSVSKIAAGQTVLRQEGAHLHLTGGKYRGKLTVLPHEDGEARQQFEPNGTVVAYATLPIERLCNQMASAAACASSLEADGILMAVCARSRNGHLEFTGTDRRKFVIVTSAEAENFDSPIPRSAAESIVTAFGDLKGNCEVEAYSNCFLVRHESGEALYLPSAGKYQSVEGIIQIIATSNTIGTARVNRKEVMEAIGAITPFADRDSTIFCNFGLGNIVLKGDNKTDGVAEHDVVAECSINEVTCVNSSYFLSVLELLKGETIELHLCHFPGNEQSRMMLVREEDRVAFVCLVQPE